MFLFLYFRPLVSIRRGGFLLDDRLPRLGEFGIQLGPFLLAVGHVVFREDGFYRAFRDAQGTIYAFVRVDDEHVWAFPKTIDGADIDAVGILALDAGLSDHVSHSNLLGFAQA